MRDKCEADLEAHRNRVAMADREFVARMECEWRTEQAERIRDYYRRVQPLSDLYGRVMTAVPFTAIIGPDGLEITRQPTPEQQALLDQIEEGIRLVAEMCGVSR